MINSRIALSIASIGAASAIIIGGTFAFFSDSETSAGNTFTSGTLDLKVNGQDNPGTLVTLTAKPSESLTPTTIELHNNGSNGGMADLHFKNVVDTGGTNTEPECVAEVGVWTSPSGPCTSPNAVKDDVSTKIGVDIGYDQDGNGTIDEGEYLIWTDSSNAGVIDPGELSWGNNSDPNNIVATLAQLNSKSFDLGLLMGGTTRKLVISFHLNANTGNEYQGDISTFDIEFTLHQLNDNTTNNIVPSGIPSPVPSPSPTPTSSP